MPAEIKPKFLFAPDHDAKELYILHRAWPACLMQVVQTIPSTLRIVDVYDDVTSEELLVHPFLEEAKNFWRTEGAKFQSGN